ncbi:hypothetical protein [Flavobacterium gawalongense]|uniref:Uncharacterized protein n=1 Tax=Flavobacterium gawalongense TaxID=2594432 RepID=A0A553BBE5_9FLAO|nr:hypothetical protein [Flavobacterium gawalongense]TRX01354.1 hypothetical protein FNW33_09585 [Flavobacterium gawalongense]TRX05571.1 hypothetical protein FNW11_15935 [Flavobacterium gawalongense]TRX05878.1 hypothetical protein FNW12_09670 [Flavobacterium gawalongense]TRX06412.1 hypothetical protein FNW10_15990 [Flavobacterium gawalongense]TRX22334.1 hypothetical protein FNW38_16025 [Flavobacterium gawalongense]
MKKIFLLILLGFTLTSIGQETEPVQFRRVYTIMTSATEEVGAKEEVEKRETTLFYNYQGTRNIKIYKEDGSTEIYVKTGPIEEGKTDGGIAWQGGLYLGENGAEIFIQLFDDQEYGVRLLFTGVGIICLQ